MPEIRLPASSIGEFLKTMVQLSNNTYFGDWNFTTWVGVLMGLAVLALILDQLWEYFDERS